MPGIGQAKPRQREKLSQVDHRKRALQAADLRATGKMTWQQVADHLGFASPHAARSAVKRHTNANSTEATRDARPRKATDRTKIDIALQAGGLNQVGMTWAEIASELGYTNAEQARRAWHRYRDQIPPREFHATREDRWSYLYQQTMRLLARAVQAMDQGEGGIDEARSVIQLAQTLLATQPPADFGETEAVAGEVLANYYLPLP